MKTIDGVGTDFEAGFEALPPSRADLPAPVPPKLRRVWVVALSLLGLVTLVAVALVLRVVVPPVAGAVGNGARAAVGAAGDGVQAAGNAWEGWTNRYRQIAADSVVAAGEDVAVTPGGESGSLLLTVTGDDGRGVAFALLAMSSDGEATLVLVPPGILGIMPGYGDFPLADSLRFEGPELAALTLTNLLGVGIDDVLGLETGDLAASLDDELTIDLPVPLIVSEGDSGRVLAKSGRAAREPAVVENILVTKGSGDQLEWLQRQAAVWEAVLDEIAVDRALADRLDARSSAGSSTASFLAGAAATDVTITAVPVTRVAVGGPDAGYTLAGQAAANFVSQRLGYLLLRTDRPRVEVLNGNGLVGTTRVVAQNLVRRGYQIIRTDNADAFDYERTQVVAQGRGNRAEADEVLRMLGSGDLLLELRTPSAVVDISIIIGADIPAGEG